MRLSTPDSYPTVALGPPGSVDYRVAMTYLAIAFALLAALLHVFIFYLESMAWTSPCARGVFGTTEAEALPTRELAFNQGFYNLFLAVLTFLGVGFLLAGHGVVGATLAFAGLGSMLAAALLLLLSSSDKRGAAVKQGIFPILAIITLVVAL